MYLDDIKVELINPEEVKKFVEMHGKMACVCYDTPIEYAERVGKNVLASGHLSGSRGDTFKFNIKAPRACIDQIVRHNVGAYPQVQSQRYVKVEDMDVYVPPIVAKDDELMMLLCYHTDYTTRIYECMINRLAELGIEGEKANEIARGVLPMNVESEMNIALSLEALINFEHKRLCTCAQEHVRKVAQLMREEVLKVAPIYKPYLVPVCDYLMYCPEDEKRCCGKHCTKKELQEIIKSSKQEQE